MKEHGISESKASIANKLARVKFATPFYLAALVAIGRRSVSLEEIEAVRRMPVRGLVQGG